MDSATAEPARGALPDLDRLRAYRVASADRLRFRIGNIDDGDQLRVMLSTLMMILLERRRG